MPRFKKETTVKVEPKDSPAAPSNKLARLRRVKHEPGTESTIRVKAEPGTDDTAQQRISVPIKQEPTDCLYIGGIRVKRELEDQPQDRRVRIKLENEFNAQQQQTAGHIKQEPKTEEENTALQSQVSPVFSDPVFSEQEGSDDNDSDEDSHEDSEEDKEPSSEGSYDSEDMHDEHDDCDCSECMGLYDGYDGDGCECFSGSEGCDCPYCRELAGYGEFDEDESVDDGPPGPVWTWGKHCGTPIKFTPGGYIHWLCREPNYFDGSSWKVRLLRQLIEARKVKITNGEDVTSPDVEVVPTVRNDDDYWGFGWC